MKVSVKWLRDYISFTQNSEDLAHALTMRGLEVDKVHYCEPDFTQVIAGEVKTVKKHPNADKLSLCTVDTGTDVVPVVCGAPNVREGIRVPLAVPGAKVGTLEIKEAKIRGEVSQGMICSERELGFSDDQSGIMVLEDDYVLGSPIDETEYARDAVLELELTPNRGDCLSMLGIAREVAMLDDAAIQYPEITLKDHTEKDIAGYVRVTIEDYTLCPRYTARIITGVKVAPSPLWLRSRLEKAGIRSINNIVDVTNYVLLEMGQPLHAFDYDLFPGKDIIVRSARKGEKIISLDDEDRKLTEQMLVIADNENALAIAGVMGGKSSEINENTTTILLESAQFLPVSIRKTSRNLGLISESSYRFERGIDPEMVAKASDRAAELIVSLAGGQIVPGMADCSAKSNEKTAISVRINRVNNVLGTDLKKTDIQKILSSLSCSIISEKDGTWDVKAPSYRYDLISEIDLIEEVARIYGYNTIMPIMPPICKQTYVDSMEETRSVIDKIRSILVGLGLDEIMTYSFISPDWIASIPVLGKNSSPVEIVNPISEDHSRMRHSLLPGLLDAVSRNLNYGNDDLSFFEIGKVFSCDKKTKEKTEEWMLGIAFAPSKTKRWIASQPVDFFYLKAIIEQLLILSDIPADFSPLVIPVFHPGRCAGVSISKEQIGIMGELHPDSSAAFDIEERRVLCAQISLETFAKYVNAKKIYREISKYPPVTRDIAVILDKKVPASDVLSVIRKAGTDLLENVQIFDVYKGDQISQDKKSIAFSLRFRSLDGTLKDNQIDGIIDRLRQSLAEKLGCEFR